MSIHAEPSKTQTEKPRVAARRIPQLDLIKIVACVMVVVMHACRKTDATVSSYHTLYYATRAAIPLFLMTNGYLQLRGRRVPWGYAVRKAASILLVSFAFAAALETASNLLIVARGGAFQLSTYKSCLTWVVQRGNNSTLWYMAMLAILTLLLPPLSRIFENGKRGLAVTAGLAGLCCAVHFSGLAALPRTGAFWEAGIPQTFRLWSWLTYFCLGGVLRQYAGRIRAGIWPRLLCAAALTAASVWFMNDVLRVQTQIVNAEYLYDSPLIIAWSLSVFILLLQCAVPEKAGGSLMLAANGTLTVYLLHYRMLPPLVEALTRAGLPGGSLALALGAAAAAFCLSGAAYAILRRIPELNRLTHI